MDGITDATFQFYADLAEDNSREFWNDNRDRYEASVREPLLALLDELSEEFGPGKLFRPHRDVRFSPDKSPYKLHQGAYVPVGESMGYYAHVDGDGLLVGGGWYSGSAKQVARYRDAIGNPQQALLLRDALRAASSGGLEPGGERIATRPRGVPADAADLDLLRYRSLHAGRRIPRSEVVAELSSLTGVVREAWRASQPLVRWLSRNVAGES